MHQHIGYLVDRLGWLARVASQLVGPARPDLWLRRLIIGLVMALGFGSLIATVSSAAQSATDFGGQELTVLNWSEYIDPDLVAAFESAHNAKVAFAYFETDQTRSEMLAANDGRGYDIVVVSGLDVATYARRGWLAPIGDAAIPNRRHIDARWATAFEGVEEHAVPYFWGTLGIAYRADLVPEPITSWKQLLDPPESFRSRIMMNKYSRDLIGTALKALGYSLNSDDPDQLHEAERLLRAQLRFVRDYSYIGLSEESALVTGDIWASMIYSGDALVLQEHNENIAYAVPEEGGNLWVDYLAILMASPHKKLAAAFINYMNRPEVAARNAEYVYYATPNNAAVSLLPADFLANPVIYPTVEVLANSEFYQPLRPRSQKLANSIMSRLLNEHTVSIQ